MGNIFGNLFKKKSSDTDKGAAVSDAARAAIVINTISDGIAIVDQKGIVNLFNPAAVAMTGWMAGDVVNLDFRSVFKLLNGSEHPMADDKNPILIALRSGKSAMSDNLFLQTAAGKHVMIAITATPILQQTTAAPRQDLAVPVADTPETTGVVITFRDITQERADRNAQTEFISTASHEMRTPVAIIEGYIGMLLNPATATVDARGLEFATKAHEAARHLGRLFQDLLDVTKLDDERLLTNPVLIDAGVAARQAVEQLAPQAATKNLALTYAAGDGIQPLYIIYVDLDHLQQILDNFITNAIKYTHVGSIKVSVGENQGKVRISVTDTGIGIAAEDVLHLFQKFYRVDNGDTREIGGTGLGLYLTKKLAENLGGQVGVASELEKGSTFFVEFDRLTRDQAIVRAQEIKKRQEKQP